MKTFWRRGWALSILSVLMLAVFLFPIYWMMATAVKPTTQIFAYPPQIIPTELDWTVWQQRIFSNRPSCATF